jgi:hypothetical protein
LKVVSDTSHDTTTNFTTSSKHRSFKYVTH